ncbi:MAG: TrmH family RNA methyltransferase [Eubacteriales bacterium]
MAELHKESDKFAESNRMEGMISFRSVIAGIESGVSDRKVLKVLFDQKKTRELGRNLSYIRAKSHQYGFEIEYTDREAIDALAVGDSHGGILTLCSARTLPEFDPAVLSERGIFFYLDGIEDPYNFGYALRSLYAAGADGVLLPPRNWMSAAGVVCRASAGASEQIPLWIADPETVADSFHAAGYRVLCADAENSVSMWESDLSAPLLIVIGGEKRGISFVLRSASDGAVRIDYGRNFPAALSAASAASILSFEVLRQNPFKREF